MFSFFLNAIIWISLITSPFSSYFSSNWISSPIKTLLQKVASQTGTKFYVDSAFGSNSNPGTETLPWKTIQKAASTLRAGDKVFVNAGTYDERINITQYNGSNGSMIDFIAQGTVQCQGFRVARDYIRVKGFTVTAIESGWTQGAYGIFVGGSNCIIENNYAYFCPTGGICTTIRSANCTIRNNQCYRNVLNGIEIEGVNHLIVNNEIWGTICYHPPTGWSPTGDANGIMYHGSGHVFRRNYIHDISFNDPENQGYSPHIDAFQTYRGGSGIGSNILFERNLIVLPEYNTSTNVRCHGFMGFGSYVTIRNNIVIAHGGTECANPEDGKTHHVTIVNNTFIGTLSTQNWPLGISLEKCPYATVKNNIIYNQGGYAIYLLGSTYTGLDIGYNCIYNSDGSTPKVSSGAIQPTDLWLVNPLFVNAAGGDYHLQSNSPCIDAGIDIPDVYQDYEANVRPLFSGWDIGAYEYNQDRPISQKNLNDIRLSTILHLTRPIWKILLKSFRHSNDNLLFQRLEKS